LTAAQELRNGVPQLPSPGVAPDVARAMTSDMLFDYLGVRLDGERAASTAIELTFRVTDRDETHAVGIRDGALHHVRDRAALDPQATVALTHDALLALATAKGTLADLEADGAVTIDGDRVALETLLSLLDTFRFWFAIVEP
jgi:alkyl sulfatase BDS1-like metallo-beta-lactamase superfamily hydrolase